MKRLPLLALVLLLFFALVGLGPAYAAVPRTQPPQRQSNRSRAHDVNPTGYATRYEQTSGDVERGSRMKSQSLCDILRGC
jgi:hypothetical protein